VPVVKEHRVDALLPLTALIDQGVTQPDAGTQIEQVLGRDIGLRQPTGHQQLTQMPRVAAVGLGPLLVAFSALASAGSARCGSAPTARSSSTTKRHPVLASNATSRC
jgi:hypothetical protein